MIDGKEPLELIPFYEGFRGTIENIGTARAVSFGEIALLESGKFEIIASKESASPEPSFYG